MDADIVDIIDTLYSDPDTGLVGQDMFWKKNKAELQQHRIDKKAVNWYFANKGLVPVKEFRLEGRPHLIAPILFYQADLMFHDGVVIFCCISMRSRRAYAYAIPDKSAKSVTDAFQQCFMDSMRAGIPVTVMTDSGKEFVNDTFDAFCKKWRMGHVAVSTADHDRLGIVERFNRTLKRRIRLYASAHKGEWKEELSEIVHGYNNTEHSVTGQKPLTTSESTPPPRYQVLHNLAIEEAIRRNYKPGTKVRMVHSPKLFEHGEAEYSSYVYEVVKQNKYTVVVKSSAGAEKKVTIDRLKRVALIPVKKKTPLGDKDASIYTVERIVGHRIEDGKVLYRIKWQGYSMSKATWESLENVRATSDLKALSPAEKKYIEELPKEVKTKLLRSLE